MSDSEADDPRSARRASPVSRIFSTRKAKQGVIHGAHIAAQKTEGVMHSIAVHRDRMLPSLKPWSIRLAKSLLLTRSCPMLEQRRC